MGKYDLKRTLTAQMLLVVCAAGLVALLTGLGGYFAGMSMVRRFYFSEEASQRRLTEEITSFRVYVAQNAVVSTDVTAVEQWNREHPYTQLTIKGLETTVRSNSYGAELVGNESGIVLQSGQAASAGTEFAVNFKDGVFSVVVYESSESVLFELVKVTAIVAGCLVFLLIVLVYDQQLTRSVQALSRQVRQVSQGELDHEISSRRRDELGQLALDVNTMRLSIIEKLQREEAAWQANSNLITAISHDVRTPLTALTGYLELLDDETLPLEQRQGYLEICKTHAQRLKGLTDELFGFFLVFGKPEPELRLEEFEAELLLEQILLEKEMELTHRGFSVTTRREAVSGKLRVDLGHLRRVFDNLFSNVRKYADPAQPVLLSQRMERGRLVMEVSNAIPATQQRVESNKIGLQTCQKLIVTMGGSFEKRQTEEVFTVEFSLPLYE